MDWRWVFIVISAAALGLVVWIIAAVPDVSGEREGRLTPLVRVIRQPDIGVILGVTAA